MEQITDDLPGIAVSLDKILVSGKHAEEHLNNLRKLLICLSDKGLHCCQEKCTFTQPRVEFLEQILAQEHIEKGHNVNTVRQASYTSKVNFHQTASLLNTSTVS